MNVPSIKAKTKVTATTLQPQHWSNRPSALGMSDPVMESLKIPRNSRNSQQVLEPFFVGRNKFWGHFLRSWSWIQKSRGSRKVNKRLMGTKGAKGVKGTKGRRGQIGQGGWGDEGDEGDGGTKVTRA